MNTLKTTFVQIFKKKESLLFLVFIIAGLSLGGYLFDNLALASFSLRYKPISPIIAVTFIVLSILQYIDIKFEKSPLAKSSVNLAYIIIPLFYGIIVIGYFFNFANSIENIFVKNANRYGNALTGYMSPIAAFLFFSICISLLLIRQYYSDIIKYIGGNLTLLVFLISSVILIAYLYKALVLFGSQIIPVALPAAICFLIFSIILFQTYELKFWTFNLLKDNKVALQLLKSFLPIVVFAVIAQGFLITNFPVVFKSSTLLVTFVLFIVVSISVIIIIKASMDLGGKLDKAEQSLKESESTLNDVQQKTGLGLWSYDPVNQQLNWSKEMFNIWGLDPKPGAPNYALHKKYIHSDDFPTFDKLFQCALEKGEAFVLEKRICRPDNSERTVITICEAVFDNTGKVIKLLGTNQDITEHKKAELALKESEKKYRFIVENVGEGIGFVNAAEEFVVVNPTAERIFGVGKGELLGRNLKEFLSEDQYLAILNQTKIRKKGQESSYEFELTRPDGTKRNIFITAVPQFDENNIFRGTNGIFRDTTEQKQAEKTLQDIIDKNPMSIQILDAEGFTLKVNEAFLLLFGSIPPLNYSMFNDIQLKEKGFEELIKRIKDGEVVHFPDMPYNPHDSVPEMPDIPVWVRTIAFPLVDSQGKPEKFVFIHENITERKQIEEGLKSRMAEITTLNIELEKFAHANEELEQFAFIASHNLQQPLRTISNYTKIFNEDYSEQMDDNARHYLNVVNDSAKRMILQLDSLLNFSRLGRNLKFTEVDCKKIIDNVVADLETIITTTNATIEVTEMPVLNVYESEFSQLFQNLITNAIKFQKKGSQPKIKISSEKLNTKWRFSISDNGIGIAPQNFEKIFEIFQRLHRDADYEGHGIGLSFCRKIVQLHKGEMWVESSIGQGTTFHFIIANLKE